MSPTVDLNEVVKDPGMLSGYPAPTLRHVKADGALIVAAAEKALADVEPVAVPAPPAADDRDDLISEKQAAAMLGRSVSTLYSQRVNKRSPYVDWVVTFPGISGVRYSRRKIRDWLARSGRTPSIGRTKLDAKSG